MKYEDIKKFSEEEREHIFNESIRDAKINGFIVGVWVIGIAAAIIIWIT